MRSFSRAKIIKILNQHGIPFDHVTQTRFVVFEDGERVPWIELWKNIQKNRIHMLPANQEFVDETLEKIGNVEPDWMKEEEEKPKPKKKRGRKKKSE